MCNLGYKNRFRSAITKVLENLRFVMRIQSSSCKQILFFRIFVRLATAIIPIITVGLIRDIINALTTDPVSGTLPFRLLTYSFLIVFLKTLIKVLLQVEYAVKDNHDEIISHELFKQIMSKSMLMKLEFFDTPEAANILRNAEIDSSAVVTYLWNIFTFISSTVSFSLSMIALGHDLNHIPLIVLITSIPDAYYKYKYTDAFYQWRLKNTMLIRKKNYFRHLATNRDYAPEIRLYNLFDFILNKHDYYADRIIKFRKVFQRKALRPVLISTLLSGTSMLYAVSIIIFKIFKGEFNAGDLAFYTGLLFLLDSSIDSLIISFNNMLRDDLQLSLIHRLLRLEEEPNWGTLRLNEIKEIEFCHVSFRYNNDSSEVLKDISFHIKSPEKIAITGENGSGVTADLKLTMRADR